MKTKWTLLIYTLCLLTSHSFSQSDIISDNGTYTYFVGTHEPDSNWRNKTFDDTQWPSASGRIGYGQNDIQTNIPKCSSVYLRIPFTGTVDEKILCLYTDFNDGFVAYINGFEIARVNLGKPGEEIAYNRCTDRSHKACDYRNYYRPLNGYYIDSSTVKQCLGDTNVLAIQIHNDSIDGSDLSFNCSLVNITNTLYSWISDHYFKQVALDSSYLPIIHINTGPYGIPSMDTAYAANMSIIHNTTGRVNRVTDVPTDYNGPISIKIHGSSSSLFPKKSFSIETLDTLGQNYNVPLIGMPKENDWILVSQFTDRSIIRNELAFILGRRMGHYEPRTRYCLLVLNGEFLGIYTLCEKIKRDANRVNIAALNTTDVSGDTITGGYILKYDDITDSSNDNVLQIVYPKSDEIQPQQSDYINQYMNDFHASLGTTVLTDATTGYRSYIDVPSLIDFIIAEEIMYNADAYHKSIYMYKNRAGKLMYGPLWDHDIAFGNFGDMLDDFNWNFMKTGAENAIRSNEIMKDTAFVRQFQDRWYQLRNGFLTDEMFISTIDSLTTDLEVEINRNFEIWPIMNSVLLGSFTNFHSYAREIDALKKWIVRRTKWINENIGNINALVSAKPYFSDEDRNCEVYPNPFSGHFSIGITSNNPSDYTIQLHDILGRQVYSNSVANSGSGNHELVIDNPVISNLPKGIYLVTVIKNDNIIYNHKLIKE